MKGYIYSIRSHLRPDIVYYGSTKETLSRRLAQHVSDYKQYLNGKKHFISSFMLIELGDSYIELVEIVEYTDKAQLRAVEGRLIRENVCVNKKQEGRSPAQDRLDNVEAIKAYETQYRKENAETMKARDALFYKANATAIKARKSVILNCGCGSQHRTGDKAKHARTKKPCAWLETQTLGQAAL